MSDIFATAKERGERAAAMQRIPGTDSYQIPGQDLPVPKEAVRVSVDRVIFGPCFNGHEEDWLNK